MKRVVPFHVYLSLVLLIVLANACKKSELIPNAIPGDIPVNQAAVARFLTLPENAGPELKGIVSNLRKAEARHPFLTRQIVANGTPDWKYTISSKSLFTGQITQHMPVKGTTSEQANESGAPVYFIPLVDSTTNELKSFLYCAKTGDSAYQYKLYNKEAILHETPKSVKSLANGTVLLSVFATFENQMHNKSTSYFGSPYLSVYKNTSITFKNASASVSSSRVKSNSYVEPANRIKVNELCWTIRSQTVEFGWGGYTVAFQMVWWQNACTGEVEIIGFFDVGGGDLGGGGSSSSGGGSGNPGGSTGGGWSPGGGYTPPPPPSSDPGAGTGSGGGGGQSGPYDPFGGPPASIDDPFWGNTPAVPVDFLTDPAPSTVMADEQMSDEDIAKEIANAEFTDPLPEKPRPSFADMKRNSIASPDWTVVANLIGSEVKTELSDPTSGHNTCATRISYALNYSGSLIPSFSQTFKGADNYNYIVQALSMLQYLKKTFKTDSSNTVHLVADLPGQPPLTANYIKAKLAGKKGIYVFIPKDASRLTGFAATGHIDLLDSDGTFASGHAYYSAKGGAKEVYLFILN